MGRNVDIAALVARADAAGTDAAGLSHLIRRSWPPASDSTQPAAREWVRRWRPACVAAPAAECGCAAGACDWCN